MTSQTQLARLEKLLGRDKLNVVAFSGGKYVFTNQPLPQSTLPPGWRGFIRSQLPVQA